MKSKKILISVTFSIMLCFISLSTGYSQSSGYPTFHRKQFSISPEFDLRYVLAIPEDYKKSQSYPLILALHYGYSGYKFPQYYGQRILENLTVPALKSLNAIIVAPDCHDQRWGDPEIAGYVVQLIKHIEKSYQIDQSKTLVTGFSMGGIGTWHFAANYPHLFKAAVPVAGMPTEENIKKIQSIPIYTINSDIDHLFPRKNIKKHVSILRKKGVEVVLPEVNGLHHNETYSFVKFLNDAVPWIQKKWSE